jgi:hypothetical protein
LPENLKRKKVRCPASNCGTIIELSGESIAPPVETFGLAAASPPPRPIPPVAGPHVPPAGLDRYLEVHVGKDKSEYVSLDEVRKRLLSGALTRKHKVRWVEPEPDEEQFQEEAESFRDVKVEAARRRWQKRQQWRRIGECLAIEEPSIESLYRLRVRFDEDTAAAGGMIAGVVVAVGLVAWLVWFVATNSSGSAGSAEVASGPSVWESLRHGNILAAWNSYQGFLVIFMALLLALAIVVVGITALSLLVARLTYYAVGWGNGLRRYIHNRRNWERPPDDGYGD